MSSTPATLSSCAPVLATTDAGSVARVMAASKRCEYRPPPTRAASADAYMVPLDALCSHAEAASGVCKAVSQPGVSFLPAHSSAAQPLRPQACCALTILACWEAKRAAWAEGPALGLDSPHAQASFIRSAAPLKRALHVCKL